MAIRIERPKTASVIFIKPPLPMGRNRTRPTSRFRWWKQAARPTKSADVPSPLVLSGRRTRRRQVVFFFNPGSRLRRADGDLPDNYPRSFPLGINPAPVELLENCKSPENILQGLFYSFAGEGKSVSSKRGRLRGASVQKPNRFQCGLRAYRL